MSHARHPRQPHPPRRAPRPDAFSDLQASELFCARCQTSRPVRERLLLVLPNGELHEYRCAVCGHSLGTRTLSAHPPGDLSLR